MYIYIYITYTIYNIQYIHLSTHRDAHPIIHVGLQWVQHVGCQRLPHLGDSWKCVRAGIVQIREKMTDRGPSNKNWEMLFVWIYIYTYIYIYIFYVSICIQMSIYIHLLWLLCIYIEHLDSHLNFGLMVKRYIHSNEAQMQRNRYSFLDASRHWRKHFAAHTTTKPAEENLEIG